MVEINSLRPRQDGRHFPDIFKSSFFNENCINCDQVFTEVCSQESNYQYSNIGSDNGSAPTRRQAIIWTNVGY